MQWILLQEDEVKRHTFELRLYSAHELKEELSRVGFREVVAYGDLAGRPYDAEATRLVVVGTK